MSLQLELKENNWLSLEDAMAYEFFMKNVVDIMNGADEKEIDITMAISKLAKASYMIAEIFCIERSKHLELPLSGASDDTNA